MRVLNWLDKAEEFSSGFLFLAGVTVSLYGVFMRYVVNQPQTWTTEIFEFLMVWAIFIGFGRALKDNRHIVVDLVYDKFPFPLKRIVSAVSNLIGAGYSFFLTYTGFQITVIAKEQQITTIDVGIPMWIPYAIMPVGMGLLGVYFVLKFIKALSGDKREIIGAYEYEQYIESQEESGSDRSDESKGGISV